MENEKKSSMTWWVILVVIIVIIIIAIAHWYATNSASTAAPTAQNTPAPSTSGSSAKPSGSSSNGSTGVPTVAGGAVLSPTNNIAVDVTKMSSLTTFVTAMKAAGLTNLLQGPGPFTLFAPSNAAFAKLPAGELTTLLKPENKQALVNLLDYHILQGAYNAADIFDGEGLSTLAFKNITFSKQTPSGAIIINGTANIISNGSSAGNGVIFVIDTVLTPPVK